MYQKSRQLSKQQRKWTREASAKNRPYAKIKKPSGFFILVHDNQPLLLQQSS